MLKKFAFVYMTLAASLFGCTGAYAAATTITATGTVASTCSFGTVNAGTLAVSAGSPSTIAAAASSGGTPASFTINYLGTPVVSITPVAAFDAEPSTSSTLSKTFTTTASSTNLGAISAGEGGALVGVEGSGNTDTFSVEMGATFGGGVGVPLGDYAVSTTVTCQ